MNYSNEEIHVRARDKAFAKVTLLNFEVSSLKDDVKNGKTGGITQQELEMVYQGTKVELQVWNYIAKLTEMKL
jgi:hypothetical protein|tara:strand:- start:964 stop:1182 length:219 start_codon:yes stop_codon:yes gene_type:complete